MTSFSNSTVEEHLQGAGIKNIAIIDDAFDPPIFSHDDIELFWNEVEENEEALEELSSYVGELAGVEDITDKVVYSIWDSRGSLVVSKHLLHFLFPKALENYQNIDGLYTHLGELNVSVTPYGTEVTAKDVGTPEILFIDYYLGSDGKGEERSKSLIKDLIHSETFKTENLPIIVLMSANENINSLSEAFREETGLIGGVFYVFSKRYLSDNSLVNGYIQSWCTNYNERGSLQSFITCICKSFEEQSKNFKQSIYSLPFEQYADLQSGYLESDGHPLGDYILAFFLEHFDTLLRQDVNLRVAKQRVDTLSLDKIPVRYEKQSDVINRLYQSYSYYAIEGYDDQNKDIRDIYQLQTGDVFVVGKEKVYIVCNAECDLAFKKGTDRERKDNIPIILVPGDLKSYQGIPVESPLGFVRLGEDDYNVFLSDEPISIPYAEIMTWAEENNCCRKFRLKPKHAFRLQQSVSEKLFRIGTHKPPPIYHTVKVKLFGKTSINENELIEIDLSKKISGQSTTIIGKDKNNGRKTLGIAYSNTVAIGEAMAAHAEKLITEAERTYPEKEKPRWYGSRVGMYKKVLEAIPGLNDYICGIPLHPQKHQIAALKTPIFHFKFDEDKVQVNDLFVIVVENDD